VSGRPTAHYAIFRVTGHDGCVPVLAQEELLRLLDFSGDQLAWECAAAIRDGGEVNVWESWSVTASHLFRTYRKRAKLAREAKLEVKGLDQAVQRFKAAGDTPVGFAFVHGHQEEFSVWLQADGATVIACFSVTVPF
jgi:hypothetical protein